MGDTANPLLPSVAPTALDQRVESYERQIITEALNIHRGELTMSQSICKSRVKTLSADEKVRAGQASLPYMT